MFEFNKNLIVVCTCAFFVMIGTLVLSRYDIDSEFTSPVRTRTHTFAVTRNHRTRYLEPKIALLMYGSLGVCVLFGGLGAYYADKIRDDDRRRDAESSRKGVSRRNRPYL